MDQPEIDRLSDLLKASTLRRYRDEHDLPEVAIAALFVNQPGGPQFWRGDRGQGQPLYLTPARPNQQPVAWRDKNGMLVVIDKSPYRDDIEWQPLYLAR